MEQNLSFCDGQVRGNNMAWKCPECGFLQHFTYRCKNCRFKCNVTITAEKLKKMRKHKESDEHWHKKKK